MARPTDTSQSSIKVAIVGGGPSGLTLASILKAVRIPFTVFELDASASARGQGGMLDIHKSSGQLALAKAGLLDEFKKRMRVDATDLYVRDQTGEIRWYHTEKENPDPERPEIDRGDLRNLLLSALDEGDVQWEKKLVRAEKEEVAQERCFSLYFANGSSATGFNILVGADGTWSRVRPLRSNVPPSYVGMTVAATRITNLDDRLPELAKFVGNGTCMSVEGKSLVVAQKSGDGSVNVYSFISVPEDWRETSGIDWSNQRRGLTEFVERYYSGWGQEAKSLIIECDEGDLAIRPLYRYPPGHRWEKTSAG
jgi:2-polyprenyl-6-methoxyphenol hydroxylase-like FAD-dependent oxidoreductase